jgi:hypothetical protein
MGDEREPYEPLWAESLRNEASPKPVAAGKPQPPAFRARPVLAIAALVAFAALLAAIVNDDLSRVTFADLPSYWESVEMTCATVRVEEGDRALELFRCKAKGAGRLPPGEYRPPETDWNSDFDRRRATDHAIRISPNGVVIGWARYAPRS